VQALEQRPKNRQEHYCGWNAQRFRVAAQINPSTKNQQLEKDPEGVLEIKDHSRHETQVIAKPALRGIVGNLADILWFYTNFSDLPPCMAWSFFKIKAAGRMLTKH
jgi:hypothetical protein